MADDPNYRGPVDRERINVNQPHEVRWWCKELGCTESELRAAVRGRDGEGREEAP